MARTKIVATIGPASSSPDKIQQLFDAGVDVFRLNMSHGDHAGHAAVIESIRKAAGPLRAVGILCDLSGPKIRLGEIEGGTVNIIAGEEMVISTEPVSGSASLVSCNYPNLPRDVNPGDPILLDDGVLELSAIETTETSVRCKVVRGGPLSSRKGLNLPGTALSVPSLTEKDRKDLEFAITHGADMVALSFVRKPEDLDDTRKAMSELGCSLPVIAKIEKAEAVAALEEIVRRSDGCMVARGDLGVEIPLEQVPLVQKRVIQLCNREAKPVITATQMLDSMIRSARPTRAEANDVANAILDGTDAVMLSGETAVGPYGVQAVEVMERIAIVTEEALDHEQMLSRNMPLAAKLEVDDAISHAAAEMACALRVADILCISSGGTTPRNLARFRPEAGVLTFTRTTRLANQLCLTWGVRSISGEQLKINPLEGPDLEAQIAAGIQLFSEKGYLSKGDRILFVAGLPLFQPGTTNMLRVIDIPVKQDCAN